MIVYSNSCSYDSADTLKTHGGTTDVNSNRKTYSELVAASLCADHTWGGKNGSCNRRIIRTTLRDLIKIKQYNEPVLALIGLSFISRTELWQPSIVAGESDGHFHSINIQHKKFHWKDGLIKTKIENIHEHVENIAIKEYYKNWLAHFQPEASVTDLLADIIMLTGWAKQHNIPYIIFANANKLPSGPDVGYESPFINSLITEVDHDPNIINLREFSFTSYAHDCGFKPFDYDLYGPHGHPDENGHAIFAKKLLAHIKTEKLI
jgi:hypothetical protein